MQRMWGNWQLVACVLLLVLSTPGCLRRERTVHEPMTWRCVPERFMKDYPDAQPVEFRYVEKPNYHEVQFGEGLCDQLTSTAKDVVIADFAVFGNWRGELLGYRFVAVDGEKIVDVGGFSTNGVTGNPGPHPLEKYFK